MNKPVWRLIEYCKVYNQQVVYGKYWKCETHTAQRNNKSLENLKEKKFKGDVSKHSRRQIMNAVNAMVLRTNWKKTWCRIEKKEVKYRLGFMTLTLPAKQMHSDTEIKDICLNDFLTKIRQNHSCHSYIWKAEPQKNGNVHFHFTVDKWIHYTLVRKYWLSAIEKLGYVTAFAAKFGHYYPPCTEIHAVQKLKNISAYMAKYLTKKSLVRLIDGRVWSCSYELSSYKFPTYTASDSIFWKIDEITKKFVKVWNMYDYCEIGLIKITDLLKNLELEFRQKLENDLGTTLNAILKN